MRLVFYGDISLHNIDAKSFHFCDRLNGLLDEADINIGNLECPLTTVDEKDESLAVTMSANSESLNLLRKFDVFSLANNHIQDFKNKGIEDTIEALKSDNLQFFGIGKDQKDALEPLLIEKDGFKIAIMGATRFANAYESQWGTGSDSNPILYRRISSLKKDGYFVVLYFHWGYEYVRIPSPRERAIAKKSIDAGADLVIGSHPHIYQTIEVYRNKTIVYSLGNFIFHSSVFDGLSYIPNDPRLNESHTFSVDIDKSFNYSTRINGYKTNDDSVVLYNQEENEKLIAEIDAVSEIMTASNWDYFKAYYKQADGISQQNAKVRNEFQQFKKQGLIDKIKLYRNANMQDVKNRLAGLFLSFFKK